MVSAISRRSREACHRIRHGFRATTAVASFSGCQPQPRWPSRIWPGTSCSRYDHCLRRSSGHVARLVCGWRVLRIIEKLRTSALYSRALLGSNPHATRGREHAYPTCHQSVRSLGTSCSACQASTHGPASARTRPKHVTLSCCSS